MEDWDLYAVVRGCTPAVASSISTAESTDAADQLISSIADQGCIFPARAADGRCFQDLFSAPWEESPDEQDQELHQLYKPFIFKSPECSHIPTISPLPVLVGLSDPAHEQPPVTKQTPQPAQAKQKQQPFSYNSSPRSKKRKIYQKRVCHVSAENLSSDVWSWRKYGQKPIKGSPYPRGYYRCSTSKGCLARKQVERDRTDPGIFIVTFTAEHNHPMPTHRNSLAGSTLHKQVETPNPDYSAKVPASTEKVDNDSSREDPPDDEDDLEDDFFAGLEGFRDGECTSGHFPAGVELSWLSSGSTTTTAGGG